MYKSIKGILKPTGSPDQCNGKIKYGEKFLIQNFEDIENPHQSIVLKNFIKNCFLKKFSIKKNYILCQYKYCNVFLA